MEVARLHWLTLLGVALSLSGCGLDPQHGNYPADVHETSSQPIELIPGMEPKIAIRGMMIVEETEKDIRQTSYEQTGSLLDQILKAIQKGLLDANPSIHTNIQTGLSLTTFCSPAPLGKRSQGSNGVDTCNLPTRVEPLLGDNIGNGKKSNYLLLALGRSERLTHDTDYTWGVAGGIGPAPMVTTETPTDFTFTVIARIYDLQTGEMVAEASASNRVSGSYGVMFIFVPYSVMPNESANYEALGHAIGKKLGDKFRVSNSSNP